jgi:hypothetical protein
MRIPTLQQIPADAGPYVSVSIDVTRTDESAAHEIDARWRALQDALLTAGAEPKLVDLIAAVVAEPAHRHGPTGRLVVAGRGGILLDLVLPERPVRDEAVVGPAPHLLPVFRALKDRAPYLLAEIDRTGADITIASEWGTDEVLAVDGDHDVIHKVPGGGLGHRRIQARAEDSWARNAGEVAAELDRLVAEHRPAVVLLAGDPVAVTDVHDAAGGAVREIAGRLRSGSRAEGASTQARDAEIAGVLARHARDTRAALVDRFRTQEGRQAAAVQSLPDVVEVARRAQIDELLLHDLPRSTDRLWVGEEPLQVGTSRADVEAIGVRQAVETRADTALVWAVVQSDAGMTLLDPDDGDLRDGIGAVLRWSDPSTPHDAVPSMPGHGQ